MSYDPEVERAERLAVVGHGVVVLVPGQNAGEPASLFGDRVMHPTPHLGLDRVQLGAHLLLARDPLEPKPPAPVLPADVREAQEIERLRLGDPTAESVSGGEPSELDQPRLLRMQLQPELREPAAK